MVSIYFNRFPRLLLDLHRRRIEGSISLRAAARHQGRPLIFLASRYLPATPVGLARRGFCF
jgi:hypothetical protein